jgi:hypothetical protein
MSAAWPVFSTVHRRDFIASLARSHEAEVPDGCQYEVVEVMFIVEQGRESVLEMELPDSFVDGNDLNGMGADFTRFPVSWKSAALFPGDWPGRTPAQNLIIHPIRQPAV